jgi:valyl-tRNA synthetase
VYQQLHERGENDFIMISKLLGLNTYDDRILKEGGKIKEMITAIRDIRNRNGLKQKDKLALYTPKETSLTEGMKQVIIKSAMLSKIEETDLEAENSFSFLSGADKFFLESPNHLDSAEEITRLQRDLEYQKVFLEGIMKKLNNESFVAKASHIIIDKERRKAEDTQEKIRVIEERLQAIEQ